MEDTAKNKIVKQLAQLIDDHKGINTVLLNLSRENSWTDYFIISTVSSYGHLKGLVKHIKDFLKDHEIEDIHRSKKISNDSWVLIDCNYFVIHLMEKEIREFYELERLWHAGEKIELSAEKVQ